MKKLIAACIIVWLFGAGAPAQEKPDKANPLFTAQPGPPAPAVPPGWEALLKASAPGPYHKLMEPFVGRWKAEGRIRRAASDETVLVEGTASNTFIFGGRYLKMEFTGKFMGQPLTGMGFMGFDNARREFTSVRFDTLSSGFLFAAGTVSADGKTFSLRGTYKDPLTGKMRELREEAAIEGPDRIVSRSFEGTPGGGDEFRSMDVVYTRIK